MLESLPEQHKMGRQEVKGLRIEGAIMTPRKKPIAAV